jgi:hypothetical protein
MRASACLVTAALLVAGAVPAADIASEPSTKADASRTSCGQTFEIVVVTIEDTLPVARALAADPTPCAEYYISVPPLPGDKTLPLAGRARLIRALGPQFHALAEVTLGTATGWVNWVQTTGRSWYEAGVEFRNRMALRGFDVALGDRWIVNEMNEGTRQDFGPYARANIRELLRGLHDAGGVHPPARGAVEIGIRFSHQTLPGVPHYKEELKAWLLDSAFWRELDGYVDWTLKEVFADTRLHSVPGTTRHGRRRHLRDYQQHLILLAQAGPPEAQAAHAFLRRTYGITMNGGWAAPGPEVQNPPFSAGRGNTQVSAEQMQHFVSEQVFAARRFMRRHPRLGTFAVGFEYQSNNSLGLPVDEFEAGLAAIRARMASSLHYAFLDGRAPAAGACGPPGSGENWCRAARQGATFTESWRIFRTWE